MNVTQDRLITSCNVEYGVSCRWRTKLHAREVTMYNTSDKEENSWNYVSANL